MNSKYKAHTHTHNGPELKLKKGCVCVCVCVCVYAQSCLTLCEPMDFSRPDSSIHGIFPGKNIGMGFHFLLQEIFHIQGSNLRLLYLLHWWVDSLPQVPPRKPRDVERKGKNKKKNQRLRLKKLNKDMIMCFRGQD